MRRSFDTASSAAADSLSFGQFGAIAADTSCSPTYFASFHSAATPSSTYAGSPAASRSGPQCEASLTGLRSALESVMSMMAGDFSGGFVFAAWGCGQRRYCLPRLALTVKSVYSRRFGVAIYRRAGCCRRLGALRAERPRMIPPAPIQQGAEMRPGHEADAHREARRERLSAAGHPYSRRRAQALRPLFERLPQNPVGDVRLELPCLEGGLWRT